jgi:AcrR family transcriptional regulator
MSRRGDTLREHILWTAREVFLEVGFERASMDVVASRAGTSKTSLYAHFESKEKLFGAFLQLIREVVLDHLKTPGDHPGPPEKALTAFCARYLEILLFEKSIQLCRLVLAEATRFPEGAQQLFDATFTEVQARLSGYLRTAAGLSPQASDKAAQQLLGQLLYPRYQRALFGIDPLAKDFDPAALAADFDLKPIRAAVASVLGSQARS